MGEFILGFLLALIYSYFVFPKKVGHSPRISPTIYPIFYKGMIIIPIFSKAIHIHHWILGLVSCIYFYKRNSFIFSFSIVLLIQGLGYSDFYKIVRDNPYKKK